MSIDVGARRLRALCGRRVDKSLVGSITAREASIHCCVACRA